MFRQVIQVGVCLSLDGALPDVCSWWWSFEKSSPLQILQPKNPSDLHILQSSFTCEILRNFPHLLIFHMGSSLSHVKIPALRLLFYFVMDKIVCDYYMLLRKIGKNTCLVVIFLFAMKNSLFVIIYYHTLHLTFFSWWGLSYPGGGESKKTLPKFMSSR